MSFLEMDSALVGVVVASGLSGVGFLFNFFREEQQWRRQKAEEDLKYQREERKREREYVRDLYQKSILNLSILLNLLDVEPNKNKDKIMKAVEDIHGWSTLLLLRHSDKTLQKYVDEFVLYPDADEAKRLREKILEVAHREEELFPISSPADTSIDTPVAPMRPSEQIEITIKIDKNFRKEKLVKFGREITATYKFSYLFSEMSVSQREKLVSLFDIYSPSCESIPKEVLLTIPNLNAEKNQAHLRMQTWYAALDPVATKPEQILMDWEAAYSQATDTASH